MERANKRNIILGLAAKQGVIRAADVASFDISAAYVHDLARNGYLDHVGRGLFSLPTYRHTENRSLVEAARYAPESVVCLLSALQFHGIGTQLPPAVWLAISNKARVPHLPFLLIQPVRMSPASLHAGVEVHVLEGVPVRIFSAAKTVADCFKYRSSVGMDVAIEALKESLSRGLFQPSDLYEYAVADRVWAIAKPYIEAVQ